jgi:class 3 adenylate cyclase
MDAADGDARPSAGPGPPAVKSSAPPESRLATSAGTELRHVSVLFCDLVGFTPFSEKRDAEEVREVLSGYFELARAIVGRYGGIVEKFIGDAVMAVWGAPVAKEDDAERAVRAGLELVSAVAVYGAEHETELQARVGIVTGGAATTETAEEGLVIGDRVNTAARIQSAASPGCCYVDETTRAATSAAIAYVDAGEHVLKGKAEPLRLFQATRVVAAVAGSQRSGVLEAAFLGTRPRAAPRQGALPRLWRAPLGPTCARLRASQASASPGFRGSSSSTSTAWSATVLWHAGSLPLVWGRRQLLGALGDGAGKPADQRRGSRRTSLRNGFAAGLERWIPDAKDREFIAPRLGQLLGLPTPKALAREELFAGWRLFFERLAEHLPVVMVIEDLQWADPGMFDFLDHLLEWSGDHAIFLLVLSRPEGTDRKGLGLSRRSVTTLPLDPLVRRGHRRAAGRPRHGTSRQAPRARIVERAEGIPLYAIETVRGCSTRASSRRLTTACAAPRRRARRARDPAGLTALIASRLDALEPRRAPAREGVLGARRELSRARRSRRSPTSTRQISTSC